jgi:hypothetical protein
MKNKTKQILKWTPSVFAGIIITLGAFMKLAEAAPLVEIYSKIGLLPYLRILGISELLFVALFLWPRTMNMGFFLLTGYFGGAMAVEWSHGNFFVVPGTILSIIWIAAYLRDASLFKLANKQGGMLNRLSGIH